MSTAEKRTPGYEAPVPSPYAVGDFSAMFTDVADLLYRTSLRSADEEILRTIHACSLPSAMNIDDHVQSAARQLKRLGTNLGDHRFTQIGGRIIEDLLALQGRQQTSQYHAELCSIDSRGQPYGLPGVANVELDNNFYQQLADAEINLRRKKQLSLVA